MGWLLDILMWAMIAVNYYAYCLRKNLQIAELRDKINTELPDKVTNFMVWFNLAVVAIALLIFAITY
jgi:hypothetical protein